MALNLNPETAEDMYELGKAYRDGEGIERDEDKAYFWFLKACEKGEIRANYYAGKFYENEGDTDAAVMYYTAGAEQGMMACMYRLYEIYKDGVGGVQKDEAKAAKYLFMSGIGRD